VQYLCLTPTACPKLRPRAGPDAPLWVSRSATELLHKTFEEVWRVSGGALMFLALGIGAIGLGLLAYGTGKSESRDKGARDAKAE
jgi:hypothetical protein